jgi:magnesium transporter
VMKGILYQNGEATTATRENVTQAASSGTFFWLDLDDAEPDDTDAVDILENTFGFHHLAVEDAEHFGQRPKVDDYDDFMYLVAAGALADGSDTVEVHLFFNEKYIVSVHRGNCAAIEEARKRIGRHRASEVAAPQIVVVYLIVDSLTDSFFPVLSAFDDKIDTLEDDILKQPTEDQLAALFDMKRSLLKIRKVVTPQRDVFAALSSGVTAVPGVTDESNRYFRDLYDHLIRISDLVDSYRDLLSGVMDTHMSTVSNRLNVVMKQLAIIATIFLPLTFITGYFGQNFAWVVNGWQATLWGWLVFGVGLNVTAIVFMMVLFKRRGWLGGPTN